MDSPEELKRRGAVQAAVVLAVAPRPGEGGADEGCIGSAGMPT